MLPCFFYSLLGFNASATARVMLPWGNNRSATLKHCAPALAIARSFIINDIQIRWLTWGISTGEVAFMAQVTEWS